MVKGSRFSFKVFLIFARFKKMEDVNKLKRKFHKWHFKKSIRWESACPMGKDRKKERYGKAGSRVLLA